MVGIAALLLWLAVYNIEVGEGQTKLGFIMSIWATADKKYLFLSAFMAIISHVIRAERWRMLLKPLGHPVSLGHGFLSVMIGYFVNLAIPRGGEVSRCYNIYKLDKTPMDISFGTVVAERVIDLFFLLSLIALAFFIELDNLLYFFSELNISGEDEGATYPITSLLILGVAGLSLSIAFIIFVFRYYKMKTLRLAVKMRTAFRGLKKGLTIVFKIKNKTLFFTYSVLIWVLYYLMSYFVIIAFPQTAELGLLAALSIFVIGGIAMAIPLPGGTGSYHVLVPFGLVLLYGLGQQESVAFSFIFHGWQTFIIIIFGLFSLLLSQYIIRKNKNV